MLNCFVLLRDASKAIAVDTDHNRLQRVGQGKLSKLVKNLSAWDLRIRIHKGRLLLRNISVRKLSPHVRKISKSVRTVLHFYRSQSIFLYNFSLQKWTWKQNFRICFLKNMLFFLLIFSPFSTDRFSLFFCKYLIPDPATQLNADPNAQLEFA